jgi:hypothetical protein
MGTTGGEVAVLRVLAGPGAEAAEVEEAVRGLRRTLAEHEVDAAPPVAGAVPVGAKGVDPVAVGELVVALSASGGAIATVAAGVKEWLARRADGHKLSITIGGDTIELARASEAERTALLSAFVERHGG